MNPEDLTIGETYFIIRYSQIYDAIFQGVLVGKREKKQEGYMFSLQEEKLKVVVLWAIDLPNVFKEDEQDNAYWQLAKVHKEKMESYVKVAEKLTKPKDDGNK